ncbi:hypothetical protein VNO78_33577 [Psophocarpus tetragonolobus]|uniref:Uncharacterized protein n=1 Tax=Psophocarpus tetragonolobus TaxID=3891 RepID=A0AAN9P498_PSOTE
MMTCVTEGACDYWLMPVQERQIRLTWKHIARKVWNQNKHSRKDDSEFTSFVVDAPALSDQKKRLSNSKESDDYFAQPTKKARIVWSKELHLLFVKVVMQIGLKSMLNSSAIFSVITAIVVELELIKKANGITQKHNQKELSNIIESRERTGACGRFDLTAFGDTSHVLCATLHPEKLSNNLLPK